MTDPDDMILAKLAFNAYSRSVGFVNYQGRDIPPWEELGPAVQAAWAAAADAVSDYLTGPDAED